MWKHPKRASLRSHCFATLEGLLKTGPGIVAPVRSAMLAAPSGSAPKPLARPTAAALDRFELPPAALVWLLPCHSLSPASDKTSHRQESSIPADCLPQPGF